MEPPAPRRPTGQLSAALRDSGPARRRDFLLRHLCGEVARFLGLDQELVDPRAGFVELGFDSLRAIEFRGLLEQQFGTELRSTLLFDQPDCDRLTDFLLAGFDDGETTSEPLRQPAPAAPTSTQIAIVGVGCRMPGPAHDPDSFWQLLADGGSAIGEPPKGRWPIDELYDPDPAVPGRIYTRRAGFLPAIERFDAAFFGIPPVEATMLDPQQRLLLEVGWETLEDAGLPPERLQSMAPGVFIGMRASEYFQSQSARLPEDADAYYATGNAVSTAAGRLSYVLGFRGPCFALDTACSGSLVAVHQAVRSIRAGECRAALAGGVNTLVDPLSSVGLCRARMLSPDGLCKTFDARADGYVRAEGCGLLLLMPVEEARAIGLPIRAVIRGSAINQDGRTGGLTVPHGPSQEAVVRAALVDAGLQADDIDYLEAHGTGTALGDPIEVAALDSVFAGRRARGRPLLVGSVKTNVGHLEAAAGISGLLKVVLAMQHELVPRHCNYQQPNPHIDWDNTEIELAETVRAWPRGARRRYAGVSSFGFSGTNAHIILEEGDPPMPLAPARQHQAVVLSAATGSALRQQALQWADAVSVNDAPPLVDVAYTSGCGRRHFDHRLGVVVGDAVEMADALRSYADGAPTGVITGTAARTPPRIAFLFSGQGAQRPGAGRELYHEEPVFRAAIDRCARVFDRLRDTPLTDVLFGDDAELLRRTDYTQPAMFALQFALTELWRSVGIRPSMVLGHSIGEITAAAAAGIMSPEDGLSLCAARGALMVQHCVSGAMLAVFASLERARQLSGPLPSDCSLAAINGPDEIVFSGAAESIHALARRLQAAGVRSQELSVSHAFHSPLMTPILPAFERRLQQLELAEPLLPLLPCRSPADRTDPARPEHWAQHVVTPVDFSAALQAAAQEADVLIEIGPSPVLLGLAARSLPRPLPAVPSLRIGMSERAQLLRGLVQCHVLGADVDFAALTRADAPRRATLPTYPFERQRFWLRHNAAPLRGAVHPLLGSPVPSVVLQPQQRLFEASLAERSPSWLADHRVYDRALFPAAALIECALAAGAQTFATDRLELRDIAIAAPLWLDALPCTTQLLVDGTPQEATFKLCCRDGDAWPVHVSGTLCELSAEFHADLPADGAAAGSTIPLQQFYGDYLAAGLVYGPAFRGVRSARRSDGAASGEVAVPTDQRADAGPFVVHPVLLDACFQLAGAATAERLGGETWLPVGIERVRVLRSAGIEGVCRAWCRPATNDRTRVLDLALLDTAGRPIVIIDGLQLVRAEAHVATAVDPTRWLHSMHWERRPRAETLAPSGSWLVTAPALHDNARALTTQLRAVGLPADAVTLQQLADAGDQLRGIVFDATASMPDSASAIADLLGSLTDCIRAAAAASPPARLCVLTSDAVAADVLDRVSSTVGSTLWGFIRSAALEHPELRPLCIDVDRRTGLDLVARELLSGDQENMVALRSEQRFAARLVRGPSCPGELQLPEGSFRLRSLEYGRLERLSAVPIDDPQPLPGEIVIAVTAAGLNFKDVLYALGLLREWSAAEGIHQAADQPIGFECAGRVVALGEGVSEFCVGDMVVAAANDAFGNRVTVAAERSFQLPSGVNVAAAAGMPTVFATAIYGLEELARVGPGDKVLIHAAAGGVGLAALQICRRIGCEVYATSSPGKAPFLRSLGIEHWADSRGKDFADVLREASGGGVDVVLNSLAGEAIPRSVALLRRGGRFVEIGKRDIWSPERMAARRPDVRYFTFDLADEVRRDPELLPRLLRKLRYGLQQGSLRPVQTTVVPIERAPQLFAAMAKGRHVGKLVLLMPRPIAVRDDRTYLLTGGTGGLGRAVARALIERGARHIALLARQGVDDDSLVDLRQHASVRVFPADVADSEQLAAALRTVRAEMPAVAGVVHAAGVLRDVLLRDLDVASIEVVLRPKIDGARYLAALLADCQLDFFACISSMAAWTGNQSQTAYSAANAWLDGWCAQRQARGHRSTSVAFGPWAEVGMAARLPSAQRSRLRELGIDSIPASVGAPLLLQSLSRSQSGLGVFPVRWSSFVRQHAQSVPPLLRTLDANGTTAASRSTGTGPDADDSGAGGSLAGRLLPLAGKARTKTLRAYLLAQLAQVLGFSTPEQVKANRTFGELGVDSLLAVEIRTRLGRALALPLPATLLFDHADVDRLTSHLLSLLPSAPATATAQPDSEIPRPRPDDIDVERALEQQVRLMEDRQ